MPTEGPHAIGVGSFGPSQAKADYSNYGLEQISVSAPGGWFRDYFGTPQHRQNANLILSAYPKHVALVDGAIDAAGQHHPRRRRARRAEGVQARRLLRLLPVPAGHLDGRAARDRCRGADHQPVRQVQRQKNIVTMGPDKAQRVLEGTAAKVPCPTPRTVDYLDEGRDATFTATCAGGLNFNGFYGHGAR